MGSGVFLDSMTRCERATGRQDSWRIGRTNSLAAVHIRQIPGVLVASKAIARRGRRARPPATSSRVRHESDLRCRAGLSLLGRCPGRRSASRGRPCWNGTRDVVSPVLLSDDGTVHLPHLNGAARKEVVIARSMRCCRRRSRQSCGGAWFRGRETSPSRAMAVVLSRSVRRAAKRHRVHLRQRPGRHRRAAAPTPAIPCIIVA